MTTPLIPTHTLDGKLLAERIDASGRIYFTDVETNRRAATKDKEPQPLPDTVIADMLNDETDPFDDGDHLDPHDLHLLDAFHNEGGAPGPEESETDEYERVEIPTVEFTFEQFAVAVAALISPHGHFEKHKMCGKRVNENEVHLHLPQANGDQKKFHVVFPETIRAEVRTIE